MTAFQIELAKKLWKWPLEQIHFSSLRELNDEERKGGGPEVRP
jgi:hypothetical protein